MSEGNDAAEAVAAITTGGTQSPSEGSTVCVAGPHLPSPQHPDESPSRAPLRARTPTRVSPYPLRLRTPPQALIPTLHPRSRTPTPQGPSGSRRVTTSPLESDQFQLVVKPIVKNSLGQRETSGETLNNFLAEGSTFRDILRKLWEKFKHRIKGRAVKVEGVWTMEPSTMSDWSKLMQFKYNNHIVDSEKTEDAWNLWMTSRRGKTIKLMIYEYGTSITKARDLESFTAACVRPLATDRSGAAAESSLRDVVSQLQSRWESSFRAESTVWRMWATHITRNLDRSTWSDAISEPPPEYITSLLRPANSQAEQQVSIWSRSAKMALDCVNASIADSQQLRKDVEALILRLDAQDKALLARKSVIEGFLYNIPPPAVSDVVDPLTTIENVDDVEHQD